MKHLLFIITVIFVVLATAAYCPGKDTQDKKNPFRPLEKAVNPTPVEVNDSNPQVPD